MRNRFCPPPAKADIATAILTNVIEHLVLLLPPNKHAFTAKAVWADLQSFFLLCFQKHWYLQHFLRFCMAPAKDVKTQKCCNLQHFVTFEKRKIVRKMCQNVTFFRFWVPSKQGGMLFETLMGDPDSVQKAFPHQAEFKRLGATAPWPMLK